MTGISYKVVVNCLLFGVTLGFTVSSNYKSGIIGGDVAKDREFPYQVSVQTRGFIKGTHACGGSIVSEKWVVTAAHCCQDSFWGLQVLAGGIYLNDKEGEEQTSNVKNMFIHPNYVDYTEGYDICLLELEEPFVFWEYVKPVGLPLPYWEPDVGSMIVVTGWGVTWAHDDQLSNTLQKVFLPIISDEQCQSYYSSNSLPKSVICAGLEKDFGGFCAGDDGGPMVDTKTNWLIGIVSWGEGCVDKPGKPGVYTRVPYFVDWIMKTINSNP